jgi:hypothetical protein
MKTTWLILKGVEITMRKTEVKGIFKICIPSCVEKHLKTAIIF